MEFWYENLGTQIRFQGQLASIELDGFRVVNQGFFFKLCSTVETQDRNF